MGDRHSTVSGIHHGGASGTGAAGVGPIQVHVTDVGHTGVQSPAGHCWGTFKRQRRDQLQWEEVHAAAKYWRGGESEEEKRVRGVGEREEGEKGRREREGKRGEGRKGHQ